jgi:metal-dependent amidase/aminoacylase/carboxypeptidase family protein
MTVDWHPDSEYAPLKNNRTMAEVYRRNAEELGRSFFEMKDVTTGSTDMGNVSQVVPSIHPSFGVGAPALNHSAEFTAVAATDAAHENMISVTKAMAMTAVEFALDPELVRRAKADFAGAK